jgi:uncharacterized protein with FMN-binding domain
LNNSKKDKEKKKGKHKMWIIIPVIIILILAATAAIALLATSGERKEGLNLPISNIDFSKLKDGTYTGEYEGGRNKWRTNKVQVTVTGGKVTDIKLLQTKENKPKEFTDDLYSQIEEKQSLQVDIVSGATITSKAYLKAVENALSKAQ